MQSNAVLFFDVFPRSSFCLFGKCFGHETFLSKVMSFRWFDQNNIPWSRQCVMVDIFLYAVNCECVGEEAFAG